MIPINIVEIGLRPGEKLYEELLIASRDIEKTENNRISVERQPAITPEELEMRLTVLYVALEKNGPSAIRSALHQVVPTFYEPEELNRDKEGKSISPVNRAGKYCLSSSESGRRHGKTDYNRTSVFQWRVYPPLNVTLAFMRSWVVS